MPIPDSMLENEEIDQNYKIYAFIYLSENSSGNTEHKITIPIKARPKPEVPGTPEEPELFRKAVEAVSEAAGRAEKAQEQAEAWTHGHEKHPERDKDNAKYYADQAKQSESNADTSEQAAAQSEQNINNTVAAFDSHVEEKKSEAGTAINKVKDAAMKAVTDQQSTSVQAVKDQTASYITEKETSAKTEIGNHTSEKIAEINKKVSEANTTLANTIADGTSLKTQLEATISSADTSKKNLDASNMAAGKTKTALDVSNTTASEAKTGLDATNKTAADLVTSLGDKITEGTQVKTDIQTTGETAMSNLQAEATKQQEYIKTSIDDTLSISGKAADAAVTGKKIDSLKGDLSEYQKKTDNTLNTTDKSIPGAINEVRSQLNNIENQTTLGIAEDGLLYIFMNGVKVGNGIDVKNMQEIISNLVAVFTADFGGSAPLASQFYSWENRVYGSAIYDALSNIQCVDNIAHLTSVYDSENSRWTKQMMCTGGLFESDNFICEFEAKFDEKAGSWNNVITYGTGTHWTNRLYSDGVKWSAGGEIDAFEQAGGYSESPTNFKTPTVHWGSGTESGYPNANEVRQGNIITFTTSEWHKFKFQLLNGYVKIWIDDILVGENDFSDCVVNNNYLYDYKPFLKPQAFYIDGSCADSSDSSNTYDFQVKNFKIYQDANIECTGLEIYPQMWEKGTELVFPTGAELFFDKIFTPSNTSNKACKWESSDTSVATVCEGYVKTLAEGTTTIKATCGDINTTYELTVNNTSASVPCAKFLISSSDLSLNNGDTSDLITYKYPKFTTDEIKYSSDNEQVATVDTTGKITSVGVGNCNIKATCGTKIDSIALTVVESNEPVLKYDLSGAITKINDRYANWSSDSSDEVYEIENKGSMGNIGNINLNIGSSSGYMWTSIIPKSSDVIIPKNNSWMYIIKGYNPTTTGAICKLKLNPTTNDNNMPCIAYTPNNSTIFIRYGGVNLYNLSSIANIIVIGHDDTGYYLWIDGQIVATGGSKTDVGYLYDIYGMKIDNLGLMRSQNNVDNISSFLNNLDMAVYLNSREYIETILTKDFGYVK